MIRVFRNTLKPQFPLNAVRLPVYNTSPSPQEDLGETISRLMRDNADLLQEVENLKQSSSGSAETGKLLKSLLPTLDGFDRVLHLGRAYPQDDTIDNWLKSVESIYFRLLNTLENYGLYQLKTVGSKVNLNLHEVVEYRPSIDYPNDTIIRERQKGYILHGRLLREAKVIVAYNERSQQQNS